MVNVGKYTSHMDPMGLGIQSNFQESLSIFLGKDIYSKGA